MEKLGAARDREAGKLAVLGKEVGKWRIEAEGDGKHLFAASLEGFDEGLFLWGTGVRPEVVGNASG